MIPVKQEDAQRSGETFDAGCFSSKSTPRRDNSDKNQKQRRHKSIDRFIMADVTPDYCIPSPTTKVKGKGKRRQRRIENVKYLLNFWNKNDEDYNENNECEMTETPFTQIVTDDGLRKIWNNFTELSGEQQDQYLAFIKHGVMNTVNGIDSKDGVNIKSTNRLTGSTNVHADFCYYRIERRLRNALRKKHLPLGLLEKLESDVIVFFEKWPKSKYTSVLSNSYERLLMHALCQYLGLSSKSVIQNGSRCTEVQAKKDENFHVPYITLSQYIRDRL